MQLMKMTEEIYLQMTVLIVANSIKQLWYIKPNIAKDGVIALQEQKNQNDNCKVQLDLDH